MSAKLHIIQDLRGRIEESQDEMEQLRRELHSQQLTLSAANCEIYQLKDRNLLQHSSWMLCNQCHKEDRAKMKAEIDHLNLLLDAKATTIFHLTEKIDDSQKSATLRTNRLSKIQRLVAYLFNL